MLPEASISLGSNTGSKNSDFSFHFGVCPVTVSLRDPCDARSQKTAHMHCYCRQAHTSNAAAKRTLHPSHVQFDTAQQEADTQENSPTAAWFCTWEHWGGERGIVQDFRASHSLARAAIAWVLKSLDTWPRSISLPYPEHELCRFSTKTMESFSITPLPSSTWGSRHTFRTGSTPIIRVTSTGTAVGTADKVLQLMTSGCLLNAQFFQMVIYPSRNSVLLHSTESGLHLFTESCLHLFSAVHTCPPIVNKSQQGPQFLMCFSRNLGNVSIGEESRS